jgi:hypothetical protein
MAHDHSFDPCTERCIYCGEGRMQIEESHAQCEGGKLKFREVLIVSQGINWLRRAIA